jgi:hypothetical protein
VFNSDDFGVQHFAYMSLLQWYVIEAAHTSPLSHKPNRVQRNQDVCLYASVSKTKEGWLFASASSFLLHENESSRRRVVKFVRVPGLTP